MPLLSLGPWTEARALADAGVGIALWMGVVGAGFVAARLFGASHPDLEALLPSTGLERVAWAIVAILVGVTEELVYRGYLRVQLAALTRSAWLGVVLQALLFGVAHLNQGVRAAVEITLDGALFGAVAYWRRGLAPCIACHVATDLLAGLAR